MNGLDYWARRVPSTKPPRLGVYGCSLAACYLFHAIPAHAYRDATVSGYFGYVSNPRTAYSPCGLRSEGLLPPRTSQSRTAPQCCAWVSRYTPARNCRADSPGCSQHGLCDAPMRADANPPNPWIVKESGFPGGPALPDKGSRVTRRTLGAYRVRTLLHYWRRCVLRVLRGVCPPGGSTAQPTRRGRGVGPRPRGPWG